VARQADAITELVNQLARLPGIGERTATRLALFLVQCPPDVPEGLADALTRVRRSVRRCGTCGNLTEADPCWVCSSPSRDRSVICAVESTSDILAIERTGDYGGLYHVLHGLIRPLDGVGPDQLNLAPLLGRVSGGEVREVIAATNPSVEGEATAMYLRGLLAPMGVVVTRIASGLPLGAELEYADRATLGRAIAARRAYD
jgi:recombination protein RecR